MVSAGTAKAGPEEAFIKTAQIIYARANTLTGNDRLEALRKVRGILDGIVSDYPASDVAVRILLQDNFEGLDVAALDAELTSVPEQEPTQTPRPALSSDVAKVEPFGGNQEDKTVPNEQLVSLEGTQLPATSQMKEGTEETEKNLGLDRQSIRDLQARLLVMGHDPNGVDGQIGKGTRAAIRAWQVTASMAPSGYLSGDQLAALQQESQERLAVWLEDEKNAKLHSPPPPIELTVANMSGRWTYTSTCGPRSKLGKGKIRGVMVLRHAGSNRFVGTLRNSQGLRAQIDGRLNGRQVTSTANFGFLIGKVKLRARVDDYQLVARGRDSNGCSFYASK